MTGGNFHPAKSAAHPSVQVLRPLLGPNSDGKSLPLPFRDFGEAVRLLEEDPRFLRVPDADRSGCGTQAVCCRSDLAPGGSCRCVICLAAVLMRGVGLSCTGSRLCVTMVCLALCHASSQSILR